MFQGEIVTFVQHGLTKGGAGEAGATISVSTSGRFEYLPIRERGPPGRNSGGGANLGGETSKAPRLEVIGSKGRSPARRKPNGG